MKYIKVYFFIYFFNLKMTDNDIEETQTKIIETKDMGQQT